MSGNERCSHCPLAADLTCRGPQLRRLCELVDPRNPKRKPEYVSVLDINSVAIQAAPATGYPPVATQAASLWRSIKGFVKSGGKLASKAERARRLAICLGCEKYDASQKRCRVCGCKNSAKVYIASDKCPLDKWSEVADS
jgi:hypothetical protein